MEGKNESKHTPGKWVEGHGLMSPQEMVAALLEENKELRDSYGSMLDLRNTALEEIERLKEAINKKHNMWVETTKSLGAKIHELDSLTKENQSLRNQLNQK